MATSKKTTDTTSKQKTNSKKTQPQPTPTAKAASTATSKSTMEQLKTEVANELGVNLKNGNLTAKEAGNVGGEMVKRMIARQSKK